MRISCLCRLMPLRDMSAFILFGLGLVISRHEVKGMARDAVTVSFGMSTYK